MIKKQTPIETAVSLAAELVAGGADVDEALSGAAWLCGLDRYELGAAWSERYESRVIEEPAPRVLVRSVTIGRHAHIILESLQGETDALAA